VGEQGVGKKREYKMEMHKESKEGECKTNTKEKWKKERQERDKNKIISRIRNRIGKAYSSEHTDIPKVFSRAH
jgi:hypothetical protein